MRRILLDISERKVGNKVDETGHLCHRIFVTRIPTTISEMSQSMSHTTLLSLCIAQQSMLISYCRVHDPPIQNCSYADLTALYYTARIPLYCTALHCNLHCTALHSIALHCNPVGFKFQDAHYYNQHSQLRVLV